jgi:uncharacterized membrane protein
MAPNTIPLSLAHLPPGSPWWLVAIIVAGLVLHIGGGGVAILAGWGTVLVRKGGRLHRLIGNVFVLAMLSMGIAGTSLAVYLGQRGNIAGGILAAYLVATGWVAARRRDGESGLFERLACVLIAGTSVMLLIWGLQDTRHPAGDGAILYFVFGGFSAFLAWLDLSVIRRGGVQGAQRIARHLWRMGFAFFFASGSFFIGQQKVMPGAVQGSPVLIVLGLAPLAILLFWVVKVRFGGRRMAAAAQA